jgi:hypothetical protein
LSKKKKPTKAAADPAVEEMALKPAGPVAVSTAVTPRPGVTEPIIHPRRKLPIVPDRPPAKSDNEDS